MSQNREHNLRRASIRLTCVDVQSGVRLQKQHTHDVQKKQAAAARRTVQSFARAAEGIQSKNQKLYCVAKRMASAIKQTQHGPCIGAPAHGKENNGKDRANQTNNSTEIDERGGSVFRAQRSRDELARSDSQGRIYCPHHSGVTRTGDNDRDVRTAGGPQHPPTDAPSMSTNVLLATALQGLLDVSSQGAAQRPRPSLRSQLKRTLFRGPARTLR